MFKKLFVACFLLSSLWLLDFLLTNNSMGVLACFGASAVLVISNPYGKMASDKAIILGMIFPTMISMAFRFALPAYNILPIISCILVMFFMCLLNFEHPPGGALAIILVSAEYNILYLFCQVLIGMVLVILSKKLLIKFSKDSGWIECIPK